MQRGVSKLVVHILILGYAVAEGEECLKEVLERHWFLWNVGGVLGEGLTSILRANLSGPWGIVA